MSGNDVDFDEPLAAHKEAWDQRDLLKTVLSRYFSVISDLGGHWPAWQIAAKEGKDIHQSLKQANEHLEKISWMAKLEPDEPWAIIILPLPDRAFPSYKSLLFRWALTFLTLTLAGNYWMSGASPENGWLNPNEFLDAVLGYTLPILGVVLLASLIHQKIATRMGTRVGPISPLPDPFIAIFVVFSVAFPNWVDPAMLVWPFGVIFFPTSPRMDARPVKDRATMGWLSLTVPTVMLGFGMALWVAGMKLTPELLAVTSMPMTLDPPFLIDSIISPMMFPADIDIRMLWAHPFAKAGAVLTLYGWLSLLPIPTLPGGRLMVAVNGIGEARSQGTQMMTFFIILFFGYFVFNAFSFASIWLLVMIMILALVLMFGNSQTFPIILDEPKGLPESARSRMRTLSFILFLFAIPAISPVASVYNWQDDLEFKFENVGYAEMSDEGVWSGSLYLEVVNQAAIAQSFSVSLVEYYDAVDNDWAFEWDCQEHQEIEYLGNGCGNEILPGRFAGFNLNYTWVGDSAPDLQQIHLITVFDEEYILTNHTISPKSMVTRASDWYFDHSDSNYRMCVDVIGKISKDSTLNVSVNYDSPLQSKDLVWIEGIGELSHEYEEVPESICLRALDPVLLRAGAFRVLTVGEDIWKPRSETNPKQLTIPQDGWTITSEYPLSWGAVFDQGGLLVSDSDQCPINPSLSTPLMPLDSEWVWDLDLKPAARIPLVEGDSNLTLVSGDADSMILCRDDFSPTPGWEFEIVEGPELILESEYLQTRIWTLGYSVFGQNTSIMNMTSFNLYNPSNESVDVRFAYSGDSEQWQVDQGNDTLEFGDNEFILSPPQASIATMWLSYQEGDVVIHLASYEV